ncbi:hypothetical protein FLONG3_11454, partial [Fusarium longipes]
MQFSISTVVATLATFHTAASWKIVAYNTDGCISSGEGAFTHEITASETVNDCFNFGEEMAGTSCIEQDVASANSG